MRRVEITAAGLARPDLGQWAGLGQERLEADPAQPPTVPGIGVGVADPPRALGWARAVPAVAVSHGAALIRTPAPLEHRGFAGGQPLLDVGRGRGRELAAVDLAEQPGSVPVGGATRHRAAQHSGQPAPGTRPDQPALAVPLTGQPASTHQRPQPLHPPVHRLQTGGDRLQPVDWRVQRLRSLMGAGWLAGEWDSERRLIRPRPGGRLTRVLRCAVPGCPADRHGAGLLCQVHRRQFAASTTADVEEWLATGEPAVFERRRCSDQRCAVTDGNGRDCPRPAEGPWRICHTHADAWDRRRLRGVGFEAFLSQASPLPEIGPCQASCCYLDAAHRDRGLCEIHYQAWRRAGRPSGRLFTRWAVTARQPTNSRVLSLRGLPNLVGLELVYAIGCRADDQVSVVTGGMRPWVDQLRGCGVGSVTAFDLATLDGVGDAHHVRFARFSVDRVRLAYADVEQERHRDVWDLRLFAQPGLADGRE